ncbi:MAG: glycine rich domain-containing protein [Bacilli bacterium]|nr:glycine rich domain-containing protein [Bacilli bacterium]
MKNRNIVIIVLILSISIGFAVLSSTLSIGSNITLADASFDVHFDNVEKVSSSIENDTYTYQDNNTVLNFNVSLDKPGDYVDYKVYVVNAGTIDAYLDSISINIPQAAQDYITYTITYNNGTNLTTGDLLKKGTDKPLKLHIEYKYDVNNFISLENTTITAVLSYKQPSQKGENVWEFDYQEAEQTFTVPKTGTYKLEVWGASGGNTTSNNKNGTGGYGGYAVGTIQLTRGNTYYINVGGKGTSGRAEKVIVGGYNGGGNATGVDTAAVFSGSGGGATHIASKAGQLKTLEKYKESILIVAGGGGGSIAYYNYWADGGSGGGYIGCNAGEIGYGSSYNWQGISTGGTQTSGGVGYSSVANVAGENGSFGRGGDYIGVRTSGGGGGYYGGGASSRQGSGGGSGYIGNPNLTSKIMYCYNCQESTEEADETHIKTRTTTNVSETPTSNYAKLGNGYAKITYIE